MDTPSGFQVSDDLSDNYERGAGPPMRPFVEAVIERAGLTTGASVLDVACGTGFVARTAAAAVGPSGRVAAVDVDGSRLEYGAAAAAAVIPTIEWHEASADAMPFANDEFDAVLCQQGLQHFPHLGSALAETARVARPGAQVVASVWAPLDRQDYFRALIEACEGQFSAESTNRMRDAFKRLPVETIIQGYESVGLVEVIAEEVTRRATIPPPEVFLELQLSILSAFADEVRVIPRERLAAAVDHLTRTLAPYRSGPEFLVPSASWIVSGIVQRTPLTIA